ncbi:MAG: leucine-rich repeat domain-containing protein [Candidatus Hodarchaeales archaeon]
MPLCLVCGEYFSRGKCPFCFPEHILDFWLDDVAILPEGALAAANELHDSSISKENQIISEISPQKERLIQKSDIKNLEIKQAVELPPQSTITSKDSRAAIRTPEMNSIAKKRVQDESSREPVNETTAESLEPAFSIAQPVTFLPAEPPPAVDDSAILQALEKELGKEIPRVDQIKWNAFGYLQEGEQIVGLGLCKQKLVTLPASLTRLENLRTLNLRNNLLIALPESFGALENLRELYLYENQLTTFPESFKRLINLKKLDIKNNQLTALSDTFQSLSKLETLLLDGNKFANFPEIITKLTQLQVLSLASNELVILSERLGDLRKLRSLSLKANLLRQLPNSLKGLRSLVRLNLDHNHFQSLPEFLFKLPALRYLNVEANPFDYDTAKRIDRYVIIFKARKKVLSY